MTSLFRHVRCALGRHHPETRKLAKNGPPMLPGWALYCHDCGRKVK